MTPHHRRTARRSALIVLLLLGRPAFASEQVEIPVSRGRIEFHAGNFQKALERFEEALRADPTNAYTLYYRGVTRGRLGDFAGAVDDLRKVVAARPDLEQAALELGVALVETQDYGDAIPWLERAQRVPALEARASFFLGIALLETRNLSAAKENLQRAAQHEEFRLRARYYLGVAAFRQSAWEEAREHFQYVVAEAPDSEIGHYAAAFLRLMQPYHLGGAVGLEYDSNVSLEPSDGTFKTALGRSEQADGRITLGLSGDYTLWRTQAAQLSLGYHFDQSLHFDLTEFNLQDHKPFLQMLFDLDRAQVGVLTSYDYYLLETDSFFQQPLAMTWLVIPEADVARSEIFYRFRWRGFFPRAFRDARNAYNNTVGFTQYFYLGKTDRYVWGGYRFDHDEPQRTSGRPFEYDGHEIEAGIGLRFPAAIFGTASYTFRHEGYADQSLGRSDDEHLIGVTARRQLTDYLSLSCGFRGDINNSNKPAFEYDRYVGSVTLEVRY